MLSLAVCAAGQPLYAQDGDANDDGAETREQERAPIDRPFVQSGVGAGSLAQLFPHLAVWLEPEDSPRVLALVEREQTSSASGAVVVLADEGQSANHELVESLRKRLAGAGWATISLGLEEPSQGLEQAREVSDRRPREPDPDADTSSADEPVMIDLNDGAATDLLEEHQGAINARLAAAVDWLSGRGYQQVVLVGIGRGAEAVHGYLPEAGPAVRRAAWVNGNFGDRRPDELTDSVSQLGIEILDLHSSLTREEPARRAAFRRSGIDGYLPMAVAIPAERPGARAAGAIFSRLVGWLTADSRKSP